MSKKKKKEMTTIIVLVAVFVGICIAYFAAIKHNEAKKKAADTSVDLLTLDSSLATKIEMDNQNGKFSFEKSGDTWTLVDKADFKVKEKAIQKLLDEFADLTATKSVVGDKNSLSEYGLDKPVATVTLTLEDGTKTVLSLGNDVPLNGGYYGMIDSSEGVYTFDKDSVSSMELGSDSFKDGDTENTEAPVSTEIE